MTSTYHCRNNIEVFFPTNESAKLTQQLSPDFCGFSTNFDECSLFWYATDDVSRRTSSFSTKLGASTTRKFSDTLIENQEDDLSSDEEQIVAKESSIQDERMATVNAEDSLIRLSQITGSC